MLIEHYKNKFQTWLAPEQVRVLPISDKYLDYARSLHAQLRAASVRAGIDHSAEKIGAKIRLAQLDKVPYMLVVGAREEETGTVAVRSRWQGDAGAMPREQFTARIQREIRTRTLQSTLAAGSTG